MSALAVQELVEAPFARALTALGRAREDVVVLSADLSKYTDVLPFADEFPDRFFQVGMAEANMMGIAGGLAKAGYLPIAVTYGVFATRRAYDQVAMALATGPSRAIVVAFLPGITTPFRATHQAIDDVALMRALPGMTVIDPADATEVDAALGFAVSEPGPVYIRGLRGRVARLFDPVGFRLEPRELQSGGTVGVVATGLATGWALEAAAAIDGGASVLHVPVLKPFPAAQVAAFCSRFDRVVSVENHSISGGLGSAVAETLAEGGMAVRLRRLGVPDQWAPAGSLDYIRHELGLDADGIAEALR
ncbi:MAG: transketolase family protein [Actinobacteria bacterium]|nr:transketolase family protein [Actinomycetota bacterium]